MSALQAGLQAMMDAGGAAPGTWHMPSESVPLGARTMLDALVPAADALIEKKGLPGAHAAAKQGAEATKTMKPKAPSRCRHGDLRPVAPRTCPSPC